MNCENAVANMQLYLDGELPDPEADLFRQHFQDCPPCHEQYLSELGFKQALKEKISWKSASEDILSQVRGMILQEAV